MAFVGVGTWNVAFTFRDNNKKVSTCTLYIDDTILFTDVLTIAAELAARLQAVSDAALIAYDISREFRNDAPPAPVPNTAEIERKLRIPMGTELRENATYIEVPSASFALEIEGTDVVNQLAPAVVALKNALTNTGGVFASTAVKTYYGEDITVTGDAFVTHRNRQPAR